MDIGRAVSLLCGGVQGKLADHHHFAFRFDDRTVHNAVFIVKDAQVGNLLAQPFDIFLRVAVFNTDQYEQTFPDFGFQLSVYGYGGMLYP